MKASLLLDELRSATVNDFGVWHDNLAKYGDLSSGMWDILKTANIGVVPADYLSWQTASGAKPNDQAWYQSASLEDLALAAHWLYRGERFCEGFWLDAFERGLFDAFISRLLLLTDELPYDPATSQWTNRYYL